MQATAWQRDHHAAVWLAVRGRQGRRGAHRAPAWLPRWGQVQGGHGRPGFLLIQNTPTEGLAESKPKQGSRLRLLQGSCTDLGGCGTSKGAEQKSEVDGDLVYDSEGAKPLAIAGLPAISGPALLANAPVFLDIFAATRVRGTDKTCSKYDTKAYFLVFFSFQNSAYLPPPQRPPSPVGRHLFGGVPGFWLPD